MKQEIMKRRSRSSPAKGSKDSQSRQVSAQPSTRLLPDRSTDQLRQQALKKQASKNQIVYMDVSGEPAQNQPSSESAQLWGTNKLAGKEKIADGFIRSKRSQMMLPQSDSPDDRLFDLQEQKSALIRRLNEGLMELDGINEEKRKMNDTLIEQIKFVRDLQGATGGIEGGDLKGMVSAEVKLEFTKEKALHKQLESQLLRAEQERSQLLARLKHLKSDKEISVLDNSIESKHFRAHQEMLTRLLHDIDHLKRQCQAVEREIEMQSYLLIQEQPSDPDLLAKERAISVLQRENGLLEQRVQDMIEREQQSAQKMGFENGRIRHLNKSTIKLFIAKSLYTVLRKLVAKQRQKAYQQIWQVTETQQRQTRKLCALHRVFYQIYKRATRNRILFWFSRTYEPKQTLSQINELLPDFYKRIDCVPLELNKYSINTDKTTTHEQRRSGLRRTAVFISKQWEIRLAQSAFQHWHRTTHPKVSAGKRLVHLKAKFNKHRTFQAFNQWVEWQKFMKVELRFYALPIKIACRKLEKRIFAELRKYSIASRLKSRSRLLRAFKNLKVSVQRTKLHRHLMSLTDKLLQKTRDSLQQACFQEISIQSETQITSDCQQQLSEIIPEIDNLARVNKQLEKTKAHQERRRAIQALLITPLAKQLTQWVYKWRSNAMTKQRQCKDCMRRLCLKVYQNKLRIAYDRMKIQQGRKTRITDHKQIDGIHGDIILRQNQNYSLALAIVQERKRIQELASKHLRTLCENAFKQNLTYWLQKWQKGVNLQKDRVSSLRFMVKKVRKSLLLQAWSKYLRGVAMIQQDINNLRRVSEVQSRLKTRFKKRVFHAIQHFADSHVLRTKSLKYLFNTIQRHNKVRGIVCWKVFTRKERELSLLITEKSEVLSMETHQNDLNSVSDLLHTKNQEVTRYRSILSLEQKLTLQKWMERFAMGGLHYGFITWRQKSDRLKHRASVLQSVRRHLVKQQLALAWFNWQEASVNLIKNDDSEYCKRVDYLTEEQIQKNKFNREQHLLRMTNLQESIPPAHEQTTLHKKRLDTVLELILKRRDNFFTFNASRHILRRWHQHAHSVHRACRALETGVAKLMFQAGFNQIRDQVRLKNYREKKLKFSLRLYKLHRKNRLLVYFNEWRDSNYNEEMAVIRETRRQTHERIETQTQLIANTWLHHGTIINQRKYAQMMQQMWDFWHQWAYQKAIKRREFQAMTQSYNAKLAKKALLLMRQRRQKDKKQMKQVEKLRLKQKKVWGYAAFYALKKYCKIAKQMSINSIAMTNALLNFQKTVAFKKILFQSQIRYEASQRRKEQSCRLLVKSIDRQLNQRLRNVQTAIQQHSRLGQRLAHILHQHLVVGRAINFRYCFYLWKNAAEKLAVVDRHENEDGPTNIDCWHLGLKNRLLAEMLTLDGQPTELIESTILQSNAQFYQLGDKTVTRLMIHNDRDLSLLPYCLDKLRSYARTMKRWREALHFCNRVTQSETFRCFRRWKEQGWRQRQALNGVAYNKLLARSDLNQRKLALVAKDVDCHLSALEQFKEQRDVLFDCYIKGQRLAFSLAKHNSEKTKQRTVRKISDFGQNLLQEQIKTQCQKNLSIISELKARISIIEDDNEKISQINDGYRSDHIFYLRNVAALNQAQQQNQDLLRDQHQQEGLIKTLMDQNNDLNQRLQLQRSEANNALELTQRLHQQKLVELEGLVLAEKESQRRRDYLSNQSQCFSHDKSVDPHHLSFNQLNSLSAQQNQQEQSPPQIVSQRPTGRSPLRMRGLQGFN